MHIIKKQQNINIEQIKAQIKNEFNKKCYGNSHEILIKNFYESILNKTDNYINIKEGIKALKIIEKIYDKEEKTW